MNASARKITSGLTAWTRSISQLQKAGGGHSALYNQLVAPAAPFIATQMLGLAMARYIWKLPAVVKEPGENLVQRIGQTVQRYLDEAAE